MGRNHTSKTRQLPREKLMDKGPSALTDEELLAVMLGRGTKGTPVHKLARTLLMMIDKKQHNSPEQFLSVHGVGHAKATLLSAAMEFARRRIHPLGLCVKKPQDLLPVYRHYADRQQEYLLCTSLNGAGEVITTRVVAVASFGRLLIEPREVFAEPTADRACRIILANNRLGTNLEPTRIEIQITRKLVQVGDMLDIPVQDRIIFNDGNFYSFAEHDVLREPLRLIDGKTVPRPGTRSPKVFPFKEDLGLVATQDI